jgi:hypothetical protein
VGCAVLGACMLCCMVYVFVVEQAVVGLHHLAVQPIHRQWRQSQGPITVSCCHSYMLLSLLLLSLVAAVRSSTGCGCCWTRCHPACRLSRQHGSRCGVGQQAQQQRSWRCYQVPAEPQQPCSAACCWRGLQPTRLFLFYLLPVAGAAYLLPVAGAK